MNREPIDIEILGDGVAFIDKNLQIVSWSPSAERITGYTQEEVSGRRCKEIIGTEFCEEKGPIQRVIETGEPIFSVITKIQVKGIEIPVSINATPLKDVHGDIIGVVLVFRNIAEMEMLTSEIKYLSEELSEKYKFGNIIGKSPKMQEIYELLKVISETSSTVLILGETGTGKDLVARAIHYNSDRKDKPFIKILCATLPENLIESELFGYVKGGFTGAVKDKPGRFELADGGTIFLDEIGELPQSMQAKLLRVIEEGEFERIGGTETTKVDVRIIAATNRDIKHLIEIGKFREDLYYRLNVAVISLPPLRNRREDIPLLIKHLIQKFREKTGKNIKGVSNSVMDILIDHSWHGNVRELENAIEHSFIHCRGKIIEVKHLPEELTTRDLPPPEQLELPLPEAEKKAILKALEKNRRHRSRTAKSLNISRTTLWRKMRKYNILPYPVSLQY